jgi:hypothetical protein
MLEADEVDEAEFESNNGGRGFARNVERLLKERGARRCVIKDKPQTQNKEARILASSAWVNRHVFMPRGWKQAVPGVLSPADGLPEEGQEQARPRAGRPGGDLRAGGEPAEERVQGADGVGRSELATPSVR